MVGNMNIIIVGGGKVGSALCMDLVSEAHDIILIEKKQSILDDLTSKLDITGVKGDGADVDTLMAANIEQCDIFISVTQSDEINMLSGVVAAHLGAKRTIVRVRNSNYFDHFSFIQSSLGITMMTNPDFLTALNIVHDLEYPYANHVDSIANNRLDLVQFDVTESLENQPIMTFRTCYKDVLVTAIKRDDEIIIPNGTHVIKKGDTLVLAGTRLAMIDFFKKVVDVRKRIENVLIVGGGKIAVYLGRKLQWLKVNFKIIENNEETAKNLAQLFPDNEIFVGDGTDMDFLIDCGLLHADAIVALTGIDEENIMLSMFAAKSTNAKVITKVNRKELLKIVDLSPLQTIVTPKALVCDDIMGIVRALDNSQGSNVTHLYRLMDNQIEVLEFEVCENAKVCYKPLKDIQTKTNVMIGYIIRNNKIIIPSGMDEILPKDIVIVISTETLNDLSEILQ